MLRSHIARLLPALSLILVALLTAAPAAAGIAGTTYYTCTIDIAGSTHDCVDGVVTVTTSSGTQRVTRVDLGDYVRLDAFVRVCNPSGWWIHFADSPSCNGYGGDFGDAEHDAEAYILGTRFDLYGMYDSGRGAYSPVYNSKNVTAASGCYRAQWTILEDRVQFDDDDDPSDSVRVQVDSIHGFETPPYDEPDGEDPSETDADRWYAGINRTVASSFRSGTGVQEVCFVLSTTETPSAATLSSLCP